MKRFVNIHTHNFTGRCIELQAVGIHPWDAEEFDISTLDEAFFHDAKAIGEIGLDFASAVDRECQKRLFERQLSWGEKLKLPVVLHCVKSFEPTMNLLSKYSLKTVIFHGFIGSKEQAATALNRGYFLSFGHRTEKSSKSIEALRITPLKQLFVETDEEVISIEDMYATIARLRGVSIEELAAATAENYIKIFTQHNE